MISPLDVALLCAEPYNRPVTIEAGDSHIIITRRDGIVYVASRGSRSALDFYEDAAALPTPGIYGSVNVGRLHPMFWADACAAFPLIVNAASGDPMYFVGHSKGGGDAEDLALLTLSLLPKQFAGYSTWGKPRNFAQDNTIGPALLIGAAGADYRFRSDPVPLEPPWLRHARPTEQVMTPRFTLNPIGDHYIESAIAALQAA